MTTTQPSGGAGPVRGGPSSSASSSARSLWPPCSAWPSSSVSCLRRRKEKLCRTDLPVRSAPGVWLLVGLGVVLVGMCVAVAGYASAASPPAPRALQGGRGASHADRMKLAGPVVMGVGLFVFICSATLLYENRDSALLLALRPPEDEEEEGGYPVVVMGGEEDRCSPQRPCCSCREGEPRHLHHQQQRQQPPGDPEQGSWTRSFSLAPSICGHHGDDEEEEEYDDADDNGVSCARGEQRGQSESPSLIGGHGRGGGGGGGREDGQQAAGVLVVEVEVEVEVEEEEEGGARLLTCVVHHQEPPGPSSPSPPPPSHRPDHAGSCNSSEIDFNVRTPLTPALP